MNNRTYSKLISSFRVAVTNSKKCSLVAFCSLIASMGFADDSIHSYERPFVNISWTPDPIETVLVEGGSFEENGKKVSIKSFLMATKEITQKQFARIMGYNPSWFANRNSASKPAEDMSWYQAVEFCNRLSLRDGLEPVYIITGRFSETVISIDYSKNGWRLPDRAEFFYAAQGGNKSKHFKYAGSDNLDEVAWYDLNSGGTPHDVGTKAPNELGLYDMSGNVWEWSNENEDEPGPSAGTMKTILGGAWCNISYDSIPIRMRGFDPMDGSYKLGIRVLRRVADNTK